jgi:hypothetical protein
MAIIFLVLSFLFCVPVYRLSIGMDWPRWLAVILAAVPVVAVFLTGIFGFLFAALFVGAMYKAASAMP